MIRIEGIIIDELGLYFPLSQHNLKHKESVKTKRSIFVFILNHGHVMWREPIRHRDLPVRFFPKQLALFTRLPQRTVLHPTRRAVHHDPRSQSEHPGIHERLRWRIRWRSSDGGPGGSPEDRGSMDGSSEDKESRPGT